VGIPQPLKESYRILRFSHESELKGQGQESYHRLTREEILPVISTGWVVKGYPHRPHHAHVVIHSLSKHLERKSPYKNNETESSAIKRQKLLGTGNPPQAEQGASPYVTGVGVFRSALLGRRCDGNEKTFYAI
jgi:hypothetical protein